MRLLLLTCLLLLILRLANIEGNSRAMWNTSREDAKVEGGAHAGPDSAVRGNVGDLSLKSSRNGHALSEHVVCFTFMDLVKDTIQFPSADGAKKLRANFWTHIL